MFYINSKSLELDLLPGSNYTLIDSRLPEKHYYQIDEASIDLKERIQLLVKAILCSIASIIFCRQYSDLKDQWKLVFHGKKILVLEGADVLAESASKPHLSRTDLANIVNSLRPILETRPPNPSNPPAPTPKNPPHGEMKTRLDYSGKQLIAIPGEILAQPNLQELILKLNDIKELPDKMSQMTQLKIVDLKVNQLSELPEWIGNLFQLERLELNRNQLSSLPKSLDQLKKLKYLDLSGNQFKTIPNVLYRLPNECHVRILGNPLSHQAIQALKEQIGKEGYCGPKFSLPEVLASNSEAATERPLTEVFPEWCELNQVQQLLTLSDKKQKRLSTYLDRLKATEKFKANTKEMKGNMAECLRWLAQESSGTYKKMAFAAFKAAAGDCDGVETCYANLMIMKDQTRGSTINKKGIKDLILSKELLLATASPDTQALILAKNPIWRALLKSQKEFTEIKAKCEKDKEMVLDQIAPEEQLAQHEQILYKIERVWNPYYVMSLALVADAQK